MRVLQVHNRYRRPGGEDRVVDAEAALLESKGHIVRRVLTENPRGTRTPAALALSVWNPAASRPIRSAACRFGAEVAHVHNTWFALTAAAVSDLPCPVVMTLHNFRLTCANALLFRDGLPCRLCLDGSSTNGIRYGCYRGPIISVPAALNVGFHRWRKTWQRHVGLFVVPTEFSRELMIVNGLPADRIVVKPNFVEDPGPRLNQADESDILLYVGRLDIEKGVALLAEAIRKTSGQYRWKIVGDGPIRHKLTGLRGVEMMGWLPRSEVDRLMKSSRALVVPSLCYEGQPMSVLEACAAGLPVLGAGHGGLGESLRSLGNDFLIQPGDLDELVAGLARLETDALIAFGSRAARLLYEDRHSLPKGLELLEATYFAAIKLGSGPYLT